MYLIRRVQGLGRYILFNLVHVGLKILDLIRKKANGSHIIMFHDVSVNCPGDFSVSIEHFKEIIEWHLDHGYVFASIDVLSSQKELRELRGKKVCIVTFDDGYRSILQLKDYLQEKRIPYCLYVVWDYLGTEDYLSVEELERISKEELCTIGNHTKSHLKARDVEEELLISEIKWTNTELERITGEPIVHFAFPYGSMESISLGAVKSVLRLRVFKTIALTIQCNLSINKYKAINRILPRYDASREDLLSVL